MCLILYCANQCQCRFWSSRIQEGNQVLLLLPLVSDTHSDPLPLRWKLVLWFPFILTGSYRGAKKDLEFLLGNNRVRQVYMNSFSFQLVLSPSFYSLSFIFYKRQKLENKTPRLVYALLSRHTFISKTIIIQKYASITPKKTLVHGRKAVKVDVLGTVSQAPVTGPPELQTSLVSCCHFRSFRATNSLREDLFSLCHFTFSVPNIYCGFQ